MDDNTIEKCVAIVVIGLIVTVGPKFGLPEGLAGTAIAAIAGLAGQSAISSFRKSRLPNDPVDAKTVA